MEYLQMFPDTFAAVKRYAPADRCLLYEAMGEYAFTGTEPDWPDDDIKWLIWEPLKQRVDLAAAFMEKQRINGGKGGRPRTQHTPEKPRETQGNPTKPTETQKKPAEPRKPPESESESESESDNKHDNARDAEQRFSRFWEVYPRHTARSAALKAWMRIKPDDALMAIMLDAVEKQKRSDQWTRDDGAYIPHPATWLNQQRWTDELPAAKPGKQVAAQQYGQRDYSQEAPEPMPDWMMTRWKEMQREGTA